MQSLLATMQFVEANRGFEGRETDQWDYDPSALLKAPKQYVGLRNQVCIAAVATVFPFTA